MSFTTDPWLWPPGRDVPPTRWATPIAAFRWHAPADGGDNSFDLLDNVICLEIGSRLAPDPGHCVLQYLFGTGDPLAPADATEAVNAAIVKPKTIEVNDRIVIKATRPDGVTTECIFDGYALAWSVVMDAGRELVQVTCVGAVRRCNDTPVRGALYRQGHVPESVDPLDQVATDIEARFNPRGVGNCALNGRINVPPDDSTGGHYPFIDPTNSILRADHPTDPGAWSLYEAVRYLGFYENLGEKYASNPIGDGLDATLVAYIPLLALQPPVTGGPPYDPANPNSYGTQDIPAPDKPVTGKPWPHAVRELIEPHGFAMRWVLETTTGGTPKTSWDVIHPQREPAKSLWLQPRGATYDAALSNLGAAEITRDLDAAVNRWEVRGAPFEYEASFVLADNFIALGEATSALDSYDVNDPSFGDRRADYREFILDECGESHYLPASAAEVKGTPADLDKLLGAPIVTNGRPVPQYVHRRRPPIGDLITTDKGPPDVESGTSDPIGRPLKWSLAISTDYAPDASIRATTLAHDVPDGGTWTLSVAFLTPDTDAATTAPLAYNANAAAVQAAVEALPNVGTGNAVATGGPFPANDIVVRLTGTRAATPASLFAVNSALTSTATGATPAATVAAQTAGKSAAVPGLWDGSGTWQKVPTGFALLPDRVGVRYTGKNPNSLDIGASTDPGAPFPSGKVNLIECLANPDDPSAASHAHPKVWFRLTCVIRDDKRLKATAGDATGQRLDSPLGDEVVTRHVDASDRYRRRTVYAPSENNNAGGAVNLDYRDDTFVAQAEAVQMQVTTLNGLLQGPVMVPRFTRFYAPGDRIDQINGRSIYFRADDGSDLRSAAWLPVVTEVRWQFGATGQRTLLTLSDADSGRGAVMRGRGIYRRKGPQSLGNGSMGSGPMPQPLAGALDILRGNR